MHSSAPSEHRLTTRRDVVAAPRKPLILVVDDQDSSRGALAVLLTTMGYASVEAANGREALATLARGIRPDLILLDLMMPVMDGWEFMKEQRRDWRLCTIPTIVITGVASHDPRCLEMPVVRFLPKPYTAEQLMAAIEAEVSHPLLRSTPIPLRDRRD
jgi:CheY-like chemotaxis protein